MLPIIVAYLLAHSGANARVYYLDDSNTVQNRDPGISYDNINNFEQSSRDLDLSFSTGDANDNNYPRETAATLPLFKRVLPIRSYAAAPSRQYFEINKEMDRPHSYYKLIEFPERRPRIEEIILDPKINGNSAQFGGTDRRGGEVVLELRVITNNEGSKS